MGFQETEKQIKWKVHFSSPIDAVYNALTTDIGRRTFWAENTVEKDGFIEFTILNYPKYKSKILEKKSPNYFHIEYFGTDVLFKLNSTDNNGTDLTLTAITSSEKVKQEMTAGWVSVLMAMKGAVDFGVDLRNHNPKRVWDKGYLDN